MKKLLDGYARFRREVYPKQRGTFQELAKGQSPEVLLIACSDSRVVPSLVTQTEPGNLFEIQNAGNIVPPHGAEPGGGVTATIEYAVVGLKVRHIVVCGHAHCGAMTGLLHPDKLGAMPLVQPWLKLAEGTRRVVSDMPTDTPDEERLKAAIRANARAQLDNLRTHPSVAAALQRGELGLHAWVYDFVEGKIEAWDANKNAWAPLPE